MNIRAYTARTLQLLLPWCVIAVIVLVTMYGLINIYTLSSGGAGKSASAPAQTVGAALTAEEIKSRLDDLKWLLTVIVFSAGIFAVAQSGAAYFNAQTFTKQADEAIARIQELAKKTEERYPVLRNTEEARTDAYRLLAAALHDQEGNDWRDMVYENMPLPERQMILSVDWFLSLDLVPRTRDAGYARDLRRLASFYASKYRYESRFGSGSIADLERAEYYLEIASKVSEDDYYLLNDIGLLYLEFYKLALKVQGQQNEKEFIDKARGFFHKSLKKHKKQQRAHYNLAVAAQREEKWQEAEQWLQEALSYVVWEATSRPDMYCRIVYNMACVKARLSYSLGHDKARYERECMDFLAEATKIGQIRQTTVDADYDKKTGDLYELYNSGNLKISNGMNELRVKLSAECGVKKTTSSHAQKFLPRLKRAVDSLLGRY
jgi:hypothetical protein